MNESSNIRRLFPGGNTSVGFYSYYHHVIDLKEANRVFFIKGGPGVGKSSMMKKIGKRMLDEGFNLEFHHCSADPDSIDAVVLPDLKIAMIDGTAPHVLDPKYPGAVDEIINLGEYWYEDPLKSNRDEIIRAIEDNSNIYKRVYKYLGAAKLIHDDIEWIYTKAMDFQKQNALTNSFIEDIFKNTKILNRESKVRHLFGSAYTHKGHIDFAESYIGIMENIYYINGKEGTGKSTILKRIVERAIEYGLNIEVFHEPLEPLKIESIIIEDLNLAITTNGKYKEKKGLSLNELLNGELLDQYKLELQNSEELFDQMIEDARVNLKKSKINHDLIESYYIPNIDFDGVNMKTEELIEKILNNK